MKLYLVDQCEKLSMCKLINVKMYQFKNVLIRNALLILKLKKLVH